LNIEKELKSTIRGREFQQFITRSLINWHVRSLWFYAWRAWIYDHECTGRG